MQKTKKNWLFSGGTKGADASAGIYTLVKTVKANGLVPMKYIKYILADMPESAFLNILNIWMIICYEIFW